MKQKHRILIGLAAILVGIGIISAFIFIKATGAFSKSGEIDTKLFNSSLHQDDVFGSSYSRDEIKTVAFRNELQHYPDTAWDISKKKDNSVMAWVEKADDDLYALIIACNTERSSIATCDSLFDGYTSATQISFNNCLDTTQVDNMEWMFGHCPNLKQINLDGIDTSNVRKMNCMFYECEKLESLDLSGFHTSSAEKMYAMFHSCESIVKLDLTGFDTARVTEMDGMFDGCSKLSDLSIGSFDTSNVTDMSGMFGGCESLEDLDLSHFNTSQVTDMSGMFSHCTNLRNVYLNGFSFGNVETMSYMFEECTNIQNLDLAMFQGINAKKDHMFSGTKYE